MDDVRARFRARVQLHLRDGWEIISMVDEPFEPLFALLTKTTIGQPRATGRGTAWSSGKHRRYCRRIVVDHSGAVRVSAVACPRDLVDDRDSGDRADTENGHGA